MVPNWERSGQGCILPPCLFNLHAEYIMRNAGLYEEQVGIKIAGRNINNLRYAGLKFNIQKTKIMASGPITSWQRNGETVETERNFIFLGFKIIADGDCNHEIKRHLLLRRKAMTNLESILKNKLLCQQMSV